MMITSQLARILNNQECPKGHGPAPSAYLVPSNSLQRSADLLNCIFRRKEERPAGKTRGNKIALTSLSNNGRKRRAPPETANSSAHPPARVALRPWSGSDTDGPGPHAWPASHAGVLSSARRRDLWVWSCRAAALGRAGVRRSLPAEAIRDASGGGARP